MQKKPLKLGALGLALLGALMLSNCASSSTAPPDSSAVSNTGPVAQLIEDGLEIGSDFQREVLQRVKETGEVSEADWKEANNRNRACLVEQGYDDVEIQYLGSKVQMLIAIPENESDADAEARRQKSFECYEKTSAYINDIYEYLNSGAQGGADVDAVQRAMFACLIDRELIPEDTSYDEFLARFLTGGDGVDDSQDGVENEEFARCIEEATG